MEVIRADDEIAITVNTEQDLRELEEAFSGHTKNKNLTTVTDDYLIAALLGWHMREIGHVETDLHLRAFTEFAFRRTTAAGYEYADEYSDLRAKLRMGKNFPGYALSVRGIDGRTKTEIEKRIDTLRFKLDEYEFLTRGVPLDDVGDVICRYVAGFTDQEIIDIGIWASLRACANETANPGPYPTEIEKELLARGCR